MPIKEFRIPFRGNYLTALTTIPSYGWYELNIQNTNLARELDVNSIRMLCRSIQATINSESGLLTVIGVFEPEAQGPDGILGNYPTSLEGIEETIDVIPPPVEYEYVAEAVLVSQSAEFRITDPPELEDTDWAQLDATAFNHATIDPWWKVINETEDPLNLIWIGVGAGIIVLHDEQAETETDITPINDPPNTWGDGVAPTVAALQFVEILGDRFIQDRFYVLAEWQEVGGDWRTWVAITSDAGTTWTWLDFFDGYILADQARARNLAVNGTYLMTILIEGNTGDAFGTDYLRVYNKSAFIGVNRTWMNNASFFDGSYIEYASVTTVTDDDDLWFVWGYIEGSPVGINAQIIYTLDAGLTWDVYEFKWFDTVVARAPDRCLALRVGPIDSVTGLREVWAVRS